jgi:DNA-binding transcriptional regulator YhcF (GntR family)
VAGRGFACSSRDETTIPPATAAGLAATYQPLGAVSLLEFRRGRGITVAGTPQRGAVLAQARKLIAFARQHGYQRDELIQMIKDLPSDA